MLATTLRLPPPKPTLHARAAAANVAPVKTRRATLYEVLRVRRDASQVEIKMAYRMLAKLYHPDAKKSCNNNNNNNNNNNCIGRDFIEIREAYDTLSDPDAKAVYDCVLLNELPCLNFGSGEGIVSYPTRKWETDQCW